MTTRYEPEIMHGGRMYGEDNYSWAGMKESYNGDYVTYEDYEDMSDQYIDLKIKYDRLVSDIGELYKEA